jgi:hypothetical protein
MKPKSEKNKHAFFQLQHYRNIKKIKSNISMFDIFSLPQ